MAIITLTTDFGTRDGYVGAMKGVILKGCKATIVDVAHDVPPHDVPHAAWIVATALRRFPPRTIHVVVVDPGVGTGRPAVVVEAKHQYFVGADNGVFAYLRHTAAWAIAKPELLAKHVSSTFHGRDVFAPIAAALANHFGRRGTLLEVGPRVELIGKLPWGPRTAGEGRVVYIDNFGNLITDLPPQEAGRSVAIAGRKLPLRETYADVAVGELLAYVGSSNTIEIAVREGRADRAIHAPRGTMVLPVRESDAYR